MNDLNSMAPELWNEIFTYLGQVDLLNVAHTCKRLRNLTKTQHESQRGLYLRSRSETLVWKSSREPRKSVSMDCCNRSAAPLPPEKSHSAHLDANVLTRAAVFNGLLFTRDTRHSATILSQSARFRQWTGWHCEACQLYANAILTGSSLRLRGKIPPAWHKMLLTQPSVLQVDIVCTSRQVTKTARNKQGVILEDIIGRLDECCKETLCYVVEIHDYVVLTEDERIRMNGKTGPLTCLASAEEDCALRITSRTKSFYRAIEGDCLLRLEKLRQMMLEKRTTSERPGFDLEI